jgi:hypothetical protein
MKSASSFKSGDDRFHMPHACFLPILLLFSLLCYLCLSFSHMTLTKRHLVRVVKEVDSKSTMLRMRRFESCRCRIFLMTSVLALFSHIWLSEGIKLSDGLILLLLPY